MPWDVTTDTLKVSLLSQETCGLMVLWLIGSRTETGSLDTSADLFSKSQADKPKGQRDIQTVVQAIGQMFSKHTGLG